MKYSIVNKNNCTSHSSNRNNIHQGLTNAQQGHNELRSNHEKRNHHNKKNYMTNQTDS
jgi:hypothetical protein